MGLDKRFAVPAVFIDAVRGPTKAKGEEKTTFQKEVNKLWNKLSTLEPFACEDIEAVRVKMDKLQVCVVLYYLCSKTFIVSL